MNLQLLYPQNSDTCTHTHTHMNLRGVSVGDGVGADDVVPDIDVGDIVVLDGSGSAIVDVSGSCPSISEMMMQKNTKGEVVSIVSGQNHINACNLAV